MLARRIRVLLVDDHPLVRAGVRRVLEAGGEMELVGEASDGTAGLAAIPVTNPDVVVLDLAMPGMDGLEVIRRARASHPALRLLVLTMHAAPEYVARAVEAGAHGYLLKESAVQDLRQAIQTVVAGGTYHSPGIQAELSRMLRDGHRPEPGGIERLTDRELEVLREIALGRSTRQIAAALQISGRTVEAHRANLMRKLGLRSVALLTQFAIREGLTETP